MCPKNHLKSHRHNNWKCLLDFYGFQKFEYGTTDVAQLFHCTFDTYDDQNLCLKATKFMCWIWLEGRVAWSEAKKYGLAPSRTIYVGYGLVGYWRWSLWYYILWQLIKITGWTEGCHCVNFVRATFGQGHCLGFFESDKVASFGFSVT